MFSNQLILTLFSILLILSSCDNNTTGDNIVDTLKDTVVTNQTPNGNSITDQTANTAETVVSLSDDSLLVPSFLLQFDFDPKVKELLDSKKETLMLSIVISGMPKKDFSSYDKDYYSTEDEIIYLADKEIAIINGKWTMDLAISKEAMNALEDQDFEIEMSCFSGRLSSEDNLFRSDFLTEPISVLKGKTHNIKVNFL